MECILIIKQKNAVMKRLLILSIFILFMSCNSDDSDEIFTEASTFLNISYGDHALQKMDIYLPPGRSASKTKVLVLIHGGGWAGGDKADFASSIDIAKEKFPDYAVINMNYRLVGNGTNYMLPAQTDDIHSVLNYLASKSQEYGIKPVFVLAGASAGGHLSMLYSYKYDTQKRVKSVVNIVGSTNLSDPYYTNYPEYSILIQYIIDPSMLPSGYTAPNFASPVSWVSNSSAPTISFFGDTDELVPPSQKTALDLKHTQYNVPHESYLYNGGHGIGGTYQNDVMAKARNFVYQNVP